MLFTNPIYITCWWDNQLQSAPQLPDRAHLSYRHSVIFSFCFWFFGTLVGFLYFMLLYLCLFYCLFYIIALIEDTGLDRLQKNSLEAIKPVFLFHWLTLLLFDFYTNLAVILHAVYIYAKSKSLLLRACTVKATLDKCTEQGGFCCRALLLQQRPQTCIL